MTSPQDEHGHAAARLCLPAGNGRRDSAGRPYRADVLARRSRRHWAAKDCKCHVSIPLKTKDKVLGVMNLAYAEDRGSFPTTKSNY